MSFVTYLLHLAFEKKKSISHQFNILGVMLLAIPTTRDNTADKLGDGALFIRYCLKGLTNWVKYCP